MLVPVVRMSLSLTVPRCWPPQSTGQPAPVLRFTLLRGGKPAQPVAPPEALEADRVRDMFETLRRRNVAAASLLVDMMTDLLRELGDNGRQR